MGRERSFLVPVVLVVAVAVLGPTAAGARDLYWSSLEVEARLNDDGSLWVTERHAMVFDGDWNGGERTFRLGPGQRVELRGITRIDDSGNRVRLAEGNLDHVDRYAWADGATVRWRSRLPGDPPFDSQQLVYVLQYRLTDILLPGGGGVYTLDHDFAFPDRSGTVERYRLDLAVDPIFQPLDELPRQVERTNLVPWESVVLTARLRYQGEGHPAAAPPPPARLEARLAGILAMAVAAAGLLLLFHRSQTGLGRAWGRLPQPQEIDRAWLEERLFVLPPEEVGALWDRKVGPPEVAAVLARLVAEGKLESEVVTRRGKSPTPGQENLRLKLLVPRDAFPGFERVLVDKLFYGGREEVTTSQLRNKYRKTGFDPAAIVRPAIEERLRHRAETSPTARPAPARWPTAALFLVALALVAAEVVLRPATGAATPLRLLVPFAITYGLAALVARGSRRHVHYLGRWTVAFTVPVAILATVVTRALLAPELASWSGFLGAGSWAYSTPGLLGTVGLALVPVAVLRSATNVAASRETREAIALRLQLLQARRHLESQLRQERPDLEDAWFPYLLALGLSTAVDRWAQAFAGTAVRAAATAGAVAASTGSFAGGSGSSGAGWTGGGGRFGGAGASTSWAAAATSMATGVSPPSSSGGSSSGGGGGGGGGGGSSGGGGGGGW